MEPVIDEKIEIKQRLARILRKDGNKTCADCSEKRPTWVSYIQPQQSFALGSKVMACFICSQCAGSHQQMGMDVCYVRNISKDEFDVEEVDYAEYSGNKIINDIFEGHLLKSTTEQVSIKPLPGADMEKKERFIRQKYFELYFYQKRTHYKHIAEMNAIFLKLRQMRKDGEHQSVGKKDRKKLSAFLSGSSNHSKSSQCETTVSNTVSTPSTNHDFEEFLDPIDKDIGEQNEKAGEERKERKQLSRGRSRSKVKGKNSSMELDDRQEQKQRHLDKSRSARSLSHGRRRMNSSRTRERPNGELDPRDRSMSRSRRSISETRRRSRASTTHEHSSSELENKQEPEMQSQSLSENRRARSIGRRGRSATNRNRPVRSDRTDPDSKDTNRNREGSKTRVRSLSRGKAAEIREKGQRSSQLRRSRSLSTNRRREKRHDTLPSDVEHKDEVTPQEDIVNHSSFNSEMGHMSGRLRRPRSLSAHGRRKSQEETVDDSTFNSEMGHMSGRLRRPRSLSKHRRMEKRHGTRTSDVEHNDEVAPQEETVNGSIFNSSNTSNIFNAMLDDNSSEHNIMSREQKKINTNGEDRVPRSSQDIMANSSASLNHSASASRYSRRKRRESVQRLLGDSNNNSGDNNTEENPDDGSAEDGFKMVASLSSRYLNASFNNSSGSLDKSSKKKGTDLFNNRRGRRKSDEPETNPRGSRKSEIFASLNRASGKSGSQEFESGSELFSSRTPIPRSMSSSEAFSSRTSINGSMSNDVWDSTLPGNRRPSVRTRNTTNPPERRSFEEKSTASAHKNKALMEAWEKMKNENDDVFVAFDKGFANFNSKSVK